MRRGFGVLRSVGLVVGLLAMASSFVIDLHAVSGGVPPRREKGHGTWEDLRVPAGPVSPQRFHARIEGSEKGRAYIPLPFDPAKVWGARARYHIAGTINGRPVRGALSQSGLGYFLPLGPAWRRDCGFHLGEDVSVEIGVEGPQREALAPDIAAALAGEPEAAEFFDALASFYRKGYLRWIDATKRRPDVRAERIAELVELLKAGRKERPR